MLAIFDVCVWFLVFGELCGGVVLCALWFLCADRANVGLVQRDYTLERVRCGQMVQMRGVLLVCCADVFVDRGHDSSSLYDRRLVLISRWRRVDSAQQGEWHEQRRRQRRLANVWDICFMSLLLGGCFRFFMNEVLSAVHA